MTLLEATYILILYKIHMDNLTVQLGSRQYHDNVQKS